MLPRPSHVLQGVRRFSHLQPLRCRVLQRGDAPSTSAAGRPKSILIGLLVLIALGVGVRIAMAQLLAPPLETYPDQVEYLDLAKSLLAGNGLSLEDDRYALPQTLLVQRMPGYPAMVAAVGAKVWAVQLVQIGLDVLTAIGAFVLARRWLDDRAGLIAAGFVLLHPFLAFFSGLVLSESAYTCLLTWSVVGLTAPGVASWHWLGLCCGAASIYFRPAGLPMTVGVVAACSLVATTRANWSPIARQTKWPIPPMLTAVLVCGLALLPWIFRNQARLGQFIPLTTNGGITLYDGWNFDNTTGGSDQSFVARMPQLGTMNEVERDAYLRQKAWKEAVAKPKRSAILMAKKLGRTWSPIPLSRSDSLGVWIVGIGFYGSLWLLTLVGLRKSEIGIWRKVVLLTPVLIVTVLHVLSVGSMRYRLPAEPMAAVLAAAGASVLLRRRIGSDVDGIESD